MDGGPSFEFYPVRGGEWQENGSLKGWVSRRLSGEAVDVVCKLDMKLVPQVVSQTLLTLLSRLSKCSS